MAADQVCKTEGCVRVANGSRGWCRACYMRWYTAHGSAERCSVEGCERTSYGRTGWCAMHYTRRRLLGSAGEAAPRFMQNATVAERFWSRVRKGDSCWTWDGSHFPDGYGLLRVSGKNKGAHVVAYELTYGPVPEGLQVDHTCHNGSSCPGGSQCPHRGCVNPAHLEAVTHAENVRRGQMPSAVIHRSGRCQAGHDMTDPANQKPVSNGRIGCRACANSRRCERYRRTGR